MKIYQTKKELTDLIGHDCGWIVNYSNGWYCNKEADNQKCTCKKEIEDQIKESKK